MRFRPNADLWAVAASWILVVASLATATYIITPDRGIAYFVMYGLVGAAGFGVALPTWWIVWRRKRTIADLGVTTQASGAQSRRAIGPLGGSVFADPGPCAAPARLGAPAAAHPMSGDWPLRSDLLAGLGAAEA